MATAEFVVHRLQVICLAGDVVYFYGIGITRS
jgi:hypothetical protein